MARVENTEVIDLFEEFFRKYYRNEIGELAQKYPREQRSLYVDWGDIYQFDPDLADDFVAQPEPMRNYAEEALRVYDLPVDVELGGAHIRVQGLRESTPIGEIQSRHRGQLVEIIGIVQKTGDVEPALVDAAFECQRCGTITRIPQTYGEFDEPPKCLGCERQGPFEINFDQSEFVDRQVVHLLDDPSKLSGKESPERLEVYLEDDAAGAVVAGDTVRMTGVVHLEQQQSNGQKTNRFDIYMKGLSVQPAAGSESDSRPSEASGIDEYVERVSTAFGTLPSEIREEETKAKLITPFVEALGWNKFDSTEVRLEYTDSKTSRYADYALFGPGSESPDVIIEAKQLGTNLQSKEQQLYNYLRIFGAEWGVLTDGEEFRMYRMDDGVPQLISEMEFGDFPGATEIVGSLKRTAFYK